MKIYFFGPRTENLETLKIYHRIVEIINKAKVAISYRADGSELINFETKILGESAEKGEMLTSKVDGFIMETSTESPETSYLLAYAVLQKKPVLCLFRKGISPQIPDHFITKNKSLKFIKISSYSKENLNGIINRWVEKVKWEDKKEDMPTIKFTLRISPKIEKFLDWKSKKIRKSKAEYLRENILEDIIEKNSEYKKYLSEEEK